MSACVSACARTCLENKKNPRSATASSCPVAVLSASPASISTRMPISSRARRAAGESSADVDWGPLPMSQCHCEPSPSSRAERCIAGCGLSPGLMWNEALCLWCSDSLDSKQVSKLKGRDAIVGQAAAAAGLAIRLQACAWTCVQTYAWKCVWTCA